MSPNKIEKRLLQVACLFLLTAGLALTLAPLVRARTTTLDWHELRGSHWIPLLLWAGGFSLLHTQLKRWMPQRDPYLLPCAALLSGWGLLTIDRLNPALGVRQGCWLFLACCLVSVGTRYPDILVQFRRFKTLGVTVGLLLTGLTLFLGINPLGAGPNLWLGGSGFYIQPSEFLKLFLAIYICAYLAERFSGEKHPSRQVFSTLVPTLALIGVALALLLVQKDLGTVCLIIFLYAVILYIAIGRTRILWISASLLTGLAAAGYVLFDVIRLRVDAWLNPWADPSGRSYQIIQSMMAIANGGLLGRGLGLGHPALVPVAHSDFIFAAISEEYGLIGAFVMIAVLAIFFQRGMLIASHVQDHFLAYLCAGTTALTTGQGALIIGGNLRLFPLTGVTLPFVSYGGSSLIMSFLILFILLHASRNLERQANQIQPRIVQLSVVMVGVFAAVGLLLVWWSVFRAPEILARTDNARRSIADYYVRRGALLDRLDAPLTASNWFVQEDSSDQGDNRGYYQRVYLYPALAPVLGYTHPVYGQSGIEAGLDPVLRGFSGNSEVVIWWNHIVYGDPPPGLDVKLTIHTALQRQADESLGGARSALVLMDARRGDILAMASSPTFDANQLGDIGDEQGTAYWQKLIQD
ncbi:MAG: FtsW/RodA/SpoVE family cell cycle protein, partial [Chloroflexota bacterium]